MQQLVELRRQVQQFELAAAIGYGGVRADQLADARRIDRRHAAHVQEDLVFPPIQRAGDDFAKLLIA